MHPFLLEYKKGLPGVLQVCDRQRRASITARPSGKTSSDMQRQGYIEIENWSDFSDRDLWVKRTSLR